MGNIRESLVSASGVVRQVQSLTNEVIEAAKAKDFAGQSTAAKQLVELTRVDGKIGRSAVTDAVRSAYGVFGSGPNELAVAGHAATAFDRTLFSPLHAAAEELAVSRAGINPLSDARRALRSITSLHTRVDDLAQVLETSAASVDDVSAARYESAVHALLDAGGRNQAVQQIGAGATKAEQAALNKLGDSILDSARLDRTLLPEFASETTFFGGVNFGNSGTYASQLSARSAGSGAKPITPTSGPTAFNLPTPGSTDPFNGKAVWYNSAFDKGTASPATNTYVAPHLLGKDDLKIPTDEMFRWSEVGFIADLDAAVAGKGLKSLAVPPIFRHTAHGRESFARANAPVTEDAMNKATRKISERIADLDEQMASLGKGNERGIDWYPVMKAFANEKDSLTRSLDDISTHWTTLRTARDEAISLGNRSTPPSREELASLADTVTQSTAQLNALLAKH